jgi:hypothetical protein
MVGEIGEFEPVEVRVTVAGCGFEAVALILGDGVEFLGVSDTGSEIEAILLMPEGSSVAWRTG